MLIGLILELIGSFYFSYHYFKKARLISSDSPFERIVCSPANLYQVGDRFSFVKKFICLNRRRVVLCKCFGIEV